MLDDDLLASLYDADNPPGDDHTFFRRLADEMDARTILDLGCGTGSLTVTLARDGRRVVGVDPSPAMLRVARGREGGEAVEWIEGDSRALADVLGEDRADLAIMSGNVAQHILDADWERTLADLAAAVRPGGILTFESRNPLAQAWRGWDVPAPGSVRETSAGLLREWCEVTEVDERGMIAGSGNVTFVSHNVLESTGESLSVPTTLAFRFPTRLIDDVEGAGFTVTSTFGGWLGETLKPTSRLIVVVAKRTP